MNYQKNDSANSKVRRSILLLAAFVAVSTLVLLVIWSTSPYRNDRIIKGIFGATFPDLEIVESRRDSFAFFDRPSQVWHVRFKHESMGLPAGASVSDKSDLGFAIDCIEGLLGRSLGELRTPSVYRMGYGRDHVYIVRDDQSKDVYVYLFAN